MSKIQAVKVAKFSAIEIAQAIQAASLPASLQGVESWESSRSIGGNTQAHLATANGKAQALGLCQLFGDFWFGAESRANIVKGLTNVKVRKAFDTATQDVIRLHGKPLEAARMLDFMRAFVSSAMSLETVKPEAVKAVESKEAAKTEAVESEEAAKTEAVESEEFLSMKAELAMLREFKKQALAAKTIKEVRAMA